MLQFNELSSSCSSISASVGIMVAADFSQEFISETDIYRIYK